MSQNKKSQMEIMGLAIIVILIVVGFSFMIRFMAQKKPAEIKEGFSSSQLTANVINTMLKTTVTTHITNNCRGMSFSDLLAKCAESGTFECTPFDIDGDSNNEKDPCEVAKDGITKILKETIGENKLKMDYYLVISTDPDGTAQLDGDFKIFNSKPSPPSPDGEQCPGSKKSSTYPVPTSTADNIYIKLDICS